MPIIRTLQRLAIAGALSLATGLALAGEVAPPASSDNDDTDAAVMIAVGLAIGSSINCASDSPLWPGLCSLLGFSAE
ncbi:MAG TPA: hypothetical protein VM011_03650 [Gammaproteobacteria bacterium]|nr:hypothetical protein [Gammaproteobacteria bacterium]